MRIVGLNILHGGGHRRPAIADEIRALNPDVVVLSEAHGSPEGDDLLQRLSAFGLAQTAVGTAPDRRVANTVAIASRTKIDDKTQPLGNKPEGHRVVQGTVGGLLLVGVYFPADRWHIPQFWRDDFLPYAKSIVNRPAVLIGDWNSGSHLLDELGKTFSGASGFEEMSAIGWTDAWRQSHPDIREYSWVSSAKNGFRIDHAFLSPGAMPRLRSVQYAHETRRPGLTDHSAIVVDLAG